jgi:hypothetical protein
MKSIFVPSLAALALSIAAGGAFAQHAERC